MAISLRPISSEKKMHGAFDLIAAARAKSSASVDFPMAGRAASTIIWPGCRPLVSWSRPAKPVDASSTRRGRERPRSVDRGIHRDRQREVIFGAVIARDVVDLGLRAVDELETGSPSPA